MGGCEGNVLRQLWGSLPTEPEAQKSRVLFEARMPQSQESPVAKTENEK
jgi:hypothetical protein